MWFVYLWLGALLILLILGRLYPMLEKAPDRVVKTLIGIALVVFLFSMGFSGAFVFTHVSEIRLGSFGFGIGESCFAVLVSTIFLVLATQVQQTRL